MGWVEVCVCYMLGGWIHGWVGGLEIKINGKEKEGEKGKLLSLGCHIMCT